jgi:hypothetical protein
VNGTVKLFQGKAFHAQVSGPDFYIWARERIHVWEGCTLLKVSNNKRAKFSACFIHMEAIGLNNIKE